MHAAASAPAPPLVPPPGPSDPNASAPSAPGCRGRGRGPLRPLRPALPRRIHLGRGQVQGHGVPEVRGTIRKGKERKQAEAGWSRTVIVFIGVRAKDRAGVQASADNDLPAGAVRGMPPVHGGGGVRGDGGHH